MVEIVTLKQLLAAYHKAVYWDLFCVNAIYANYMSIFTSNKCTLVLYADDSVLMVSDKNVNSVSMYYVKM